MDVKKAHEEAKRKQKIDANWVTCQNLHHVKLKYSGLWARFLGLSEILKSHLFNIQFRLSADKLKCVIELSMERRIKTFAKHFCTLETER